MGYWSDLRAWIFQDPAKLIRYLVLFVCCIVVIVQLYECFSKLYDPPLSTHSYYNLNETLEMPAVTICREPPYKDDELKAMSGGECPHPKYITCWNKYPYEELSLAEFFTNGTFNQNDTFLGTQYALNGFTYNVEVTSSLNFYMGRCHTVRPKIMLKRACRESGYSIMLTHHVSNLTDDRTLYERQPGWHIYIHDQRENFTEINIMGSGRIEYAFAEINEEIEIKLQTQHFSSVESRQQACSRQAGYSDLKCAEMCLTKAVAAKSNCSGPWMPNVSQPPCANSKSMRNLTSEYSQAYDNANQMDCDCVPPCESRIFSTYIQNRKQLYVEEPQTQVWIYYTTKLVSMVEERPSYDTTQFIADIGGSLGFLLGLSVLGLIGILENITLFCCGGLIKKIQLKEEKRLKLEADQQSQKSDTTIDVAVASEKGLDSKY